MNVGKLTESWCKEQGLQVEYFDSLTSTNDIAKDEAFKIKETPKVYIADQQSSGRGRGQHQWSNPDPGTGLQWSWSLPMNMAPQHLTGPLIGVSLYQSLKEVWPQLGWSIKAPNDIYLENKKVAGFLVESLSQGSQAWIIVGLGLNIFHHPETVPHAGSIVSDVGLSSLEEEEWRRFLNCYKVRLEQALGEVVKTKLDVNHRETLLKAINANPWKQETIIDVDENGDLVCENKTISWMSL